MRTPDLGSDSAGGLPTAHLPYPVIPVRSLVAGKALETARSSTWRSSAVRQPIVLTD